MTFLTEPKTDRVGIESASSPDFLTIQALRAVAALLVVLGHALGAWDERVEGLAPGVGWANGASGVDIFFIISGFVMVISSRGLRHQPVSWQIFLRRRIIRIVPLYWLLTTVKIVAVLLLSSVVLRTRLDFNLVAGSYLFLPVVDSGGHLRPVLPVGWTLTYEVIFYLLFAAALAVRVDVLRVTIPALGLMAAVALIRTEAWPAWTIIFNTIVLEFGVGVILAKWFLQGGRLNPAISAGLVVAGFAAILLTPMVSDNARPITWGIPAFAIVAGAVSLEHLVGRSIPFWLRTLGDASYSLYLSHGFVLPTLVLLISKGRSPDLCTQILTITLCLFVASGVGIILFNWIENPLLWTMKHRWRLKVNQHRQA